MVIGFFEYYLDDKQRLFIPVKLRTGQKKFILTRGLEGCIFVYTPGNWNKILKKLKKLPLSKKEARTFIRIFVSSASEVEIDGQGRVLLPQYLGEYAGLNKKVVITGFFDRLEIWAKERWDKFHRESEKIFTEVAEKFVDLNI